MAAHALGLLFWQKAGLVVPLLLAVDLLVLAAGTPWRARLRGLRERAWFWVAHLALLGGYVLVYLAVTSTEALAAEADRGLGATLHDVLLRTLLPGLFGGPWQVTGAGSTIYPDTAPALQVLFAVLAALVVAGQRPQGGCGRLGGMGPGGGLPHRRPGPADGRAGRLPPARGPGPALRDRRPARHRDRGLRGLRRRPGAASRAPAGPTGPDSGPADVGTRVRRTRTSLPWLLLATVVVSGLVTTLRLAPETQHPQSERYVRGVTSALAAAPGAAVLQTPVPSDVAISVNLESLLRAVGREQRLDRPGAEPLLVGPTGQLVRAGLADADVAQRGPIADCGWRLGPDPQWVAVLPPPDAGPRLLRLGYLAGSGGVLHVAVGGLEQAVEYTAGVGERYVVVTEQSGPVQVWVTGASSAFCLGDVTRGTPVPAL